MSDGREGWDVFISHASEDKDAVAKPLADILVERGVHVWYDEFSLSLGDSLRRSIDQGLALSRFGVVILSQSFFAKEWPQRELDGLVARELNEGKVILPVWHGLTHEDVATHSPMLADRVAISTESGLQAVADEILSVLATQEPAASDEAAPSNSSTSYRAPSAVEIAGSLDSHLTDAEDRVSLLHSQRGVDAARASVDDLFDELQRQADEVTKVYPRFAFRTERRGRAAVLSLNQNSVTVSWSLQWANTLEHSSLVIRFWNGIVSLRGRVTWDEPVVVEDVSRYFDVRGIGGYGWTLKEGADFLTNRELADFLIRTLLEMSTAS